MAEVEKVSSAAAVSTTSVTAADIPVSGGASSAAEFGTSPTQERSSNSHPHDSEYDTASDLEGGEEYDDDEDDDLDDESMTDGESITDDDDDVEEDERPIMGAEKVDAEAQKKVDEDRSNPQYIPKRGTFYEHDDRTAEGDPDVTLVTGEAGDPHDGANGVKSPQSPTISQASKTMKKWQPASGVERWSHDRFDESEQAPKSRAELVSAYGYDIRTEDAPPRARRRRRYGRGPSKYLRNWEDENAYLKASNKDRKPPRPSDFPALNERNTKTRRVRSTREEKENRMERRAASDKIPSEGSARPGNQDERRDVKASGSSNQKSKNNYGRPNAQMGRQAAMEFKQQKQRNGQPHQPSTSQNNASNNRNDAQYERQSNRQQHSHNTTVNDQQQQQQRPGGGNKSQSHSRQQQQTQPQPQQHDTYNNNQSNNKQHEYSSYQQMQPSPQQQPMSIRQPVQSKNAASGSNLSQRLQQVQNRNDPSHVGSVQMHALATQNQMVNQQQPQPQPTNMILSPAQPQQQQPTAPMEQRGPPKRYSSLRRSQHEAQHLAEQLQQMQLQQQHQPQGPIMLPEQHMIPANLMQLYHQEMQVLQASQPPGQPKQPAYATVPAGAQPQPQPYASATGAAAAPTAYYVAAAPDAYAATAAANAQAQPPAQYAQQPPPNYMPAPQAAPTAAPLAYASAPPPTQQPVPGAAPPAYAPATAVPPAATAAAAAGAAPPNTNPNFPNYQNYNTVGGTTYFVPPAQTTTRPVVLPQRRPTNAIPILPPSEKNKQRAAESKDETKTGGANATSQPAAPIGSAENIDHIIDNMFVQRPVLQPQRQAFQPQQAASSQARKSSSPSSGAENNAGAGTTELSSNSTTPAPQADDTAPNNVPTTSSGDKVSSASADGAAAESSNNNAPIAAQE